MSVVPCANVGKTRVGSPAERGAQSLEDSAHSALGHDLLGAVPRRLVDHYITSGASSALEKERKKEKSREKETRRTSPRWKVAGGRGGEVVRVLGLQPALDEVHGTLHERAQAPSQEARHHQPGGASSA